MLLMIDNCDAGITLTHPVSKARLSILVFCVFVAQEIKRPHHSVQKTG